MAPFWATLAYREGRSTVRRIGVYMLSISLGVAALVALHSFRADITRSVQNEARSLLGADLRLGRASTMPDSVLAIVDSLVTSGARSARLTNLVSMALAEPSGSTRLVQIQAIAGPYPLYGNVTTDPPGLWAGISTMGSSALVDDALLTQLDARVGDTLSIGRALFRIAGTVQGLPTDLGFQAAIGPRVYIAADQLDGTGLLGFGSLARHRHYLGLAEGAAEAIDERYRDVFRRYGIATTTAAEQAEDLTDATRVLSRFLGLIGLAALLMGGVGVGSAVHVFVRAKLTSIAVLRCLGASQRTVFSAYLAQAGALGLLGSLVGVTMGLAIQALLPRYVVDLLPLGVDTRVHGAAVLSGLAIGLWTTLIFAWIPLLDVWNAPPLRALRRNAEADAGSAARRWSIAALLTSLVGLSVLEAPTAKMGLGFAAGLGVTLVLLWLAARGLVRATRSLVPSGSRYSVRQGVSNLFRPRNQTVAITLALGFGAFLITTVLTVERNLAEQLLGDEGADRPNLLLFDIQPDQRNGVLELASASADGPLELTPVVPSQIEAINGVAAATLLEDDSDEAPERWAVRRLYRNTYRGELTETEVLVDGVWLGDTGDPSVFGVSLEDDLARDLRVGLGDRITWSVQGLTVDSEVTSLRQVDWTRFEPNFFVVFPPGALDTAPQTAMGLVRVADPERRALMQRDLVRAFPNVSALDLALVQEAIDRVLRKAGQAIGFLATASVIVGVLVLIGALATSRFQRMRESALLKALGADRRTIVEIFFVEYVVLGTLASTLGIALGAAASWGVVRFVFEGSYRLPWVLLAGLSMATLLLTLAIGLLGTRPVLRRQPLAVLREVAE